MKIRCRCCCSWIVYSKPKFLCLVHSIVCLFQVMSCNLILRFKWSSTNKRNLLIIIYSLFFFNSLRFVPLPLSSIDPVSYWVSTFTESMLVLILNSISYKEGWFNSTTNTLILSLLPLSRLQSMKLYKASCNRS